MRKAATSDIEIECQNHANCGDYCETPREIAMVLCEDCLDSYDMRERERIELKALREENAELRAALSKQSDQPVAFRECRVISFRPGMGEVTFRVAGGVPDFMDPGCTIYVSEASPIAQIAPRPTGLSQGWNLVRQCDGFVIGHSSDEPKERHKAQALLDGRIYVPFLVAQTAPQPEQSGLVAVLERIKRDTVKDDPLGHYDAVCHALSEYRAALSAQGGRYAR